MYLISAEGYKICKRWHFKNNKTDEIWVSMKGLYDVLGVKSMPDLVLKEIYGKY